MNSIEMLWRTEDVLRSRGVRCKVKFLGYIEMKDHDHVYAPGAGCWQPQREQKAEDLTGKEVTSGVSNVV